MDRIRQRFQAWRGGGGIDIGGGGERLVRTLPSPLPLRIADHAWGGSDTCTFPSLLLGAPHSGPCNVLMREAGPLTFLPSPVPLHSPGSARGRSCAHPLNFPPFPSPLYIPGHARGRADAL